MGYFPPTGESLPLHIQKIYIVLLPILQINVINFKMIGFKYFVLGWLVDFLWHKDQKGHALPTYLVQL